ncbi:MAG: dihydrolipoamide acetyltransferase family protein [Proteobacteria bacterium]|nr:dihydrolipoamide acetyltransferase family protein [Pseudomonadota bacterium]
MQTETTEVLMPLMGEGITEATLVKWLKQPGDVLRQNEPLLEVSTDKVDTEIPAPAAGTLLQVFAKDGEVVAVNQIIAYIGNPATAAAAVSPSKAAAPVGAHAAAPRPVTATVVQPQDMTEAAPRRSSPLVRKIAKAEQVDLTQVAGTGLHGRITKRDLEAHQSKAPLQAITTPTVATGGTLKTTIDGGKETLEGVVVRREKMTRMRALIAEHMVRSVRTSPHVTTVFEIDMHRVVTLRDQSKAAFASREGFNLTFTPFFVYAAVQAIKRFPIVNCSVDGDDILWKDQINIGVAVAIDNGLIVPVIRDAGELNVLGVARRLQDLAQRARTKKLLPEDVQGGTFSVTNPGMFGSIVSTPIISQPQVAILSIGAIIKRPVVIDDLIGIRPLVQIGLTFDHRVVDGEGGARYLAFLKKTLEEFSQAAL